jgi:hypothetical protein
MDHRITNSLHTLYYVMGHVNLAGMYNKHASHILQIIYCDLVHKLYNSWPILTELNESWPNVTQWLRTPEEPNIKNSNSERCDIAGLIYCQHPNSSFTGSHASG